MKINEITNTLKTFVATVSVSGVAIKTTVQSDSVSHARLLLQRIYGESNVFSTNEIYLDEQLSSTKTLTPDQLKLKSLADKKAQISDQLKLERERQKLAKAQQGIQKTNNEKLMAKFSC